MKKKQTSRFRSAQLYVRVTKTGLWGFVLSSYLPVCLWQQFFYLFFCKACDVHIYTVYRSLLYVKYDNM